MLSPQDLIGQKVWLSVPVDPEYGLREYGQDQQHQIQAEITQPTSPPWFFARYLNPPSGQHSGQWLSLYEAQQAVLLNPVIEYDEDESEEGDNQPDEFDLYRYRDELNFR